MRERESGSSRGFVPRVQFEDAKRSSVGERSGSGSGKSPQKALRKAACGLVVVGGEKHTGRGLAPATGMHSCGIRHGPIER